MRPFARSKPLTDPPALLTPPSLFLTAPYPRRRQPAGLVYSGQPGPLHVDCNLRSCSVRPRASAPLTCLDDELASQALGAVTATSLHPQHMLVNRMEASLETFSTTVSIDVICRSNCCWHQARMRILDTLQLIVHSNIST